MQINKRSVFTLSANNPPCWQRLFTKKKRRSLSICFSGVDGKEHAFWRDRREFQPTFRQTFFLPFKISYRIGKESFNKN